MYRTTALLLLPIAVEGCTPGPAPSSAEPDAVLLKARAMQAFVCVHLERAPPSWKSEFRLSGPGGQNEVWQTLSDQPLVDHGRKVSSVYRKSTDQLYLVVTGGFPETMTVYGPLSRAPECQPSSKGIDTSAA
jgi:hypothetical protein